MNEAAAPLRFAHLFGGTSLRHDSYHDRTIREFRTSAHGGVEIGKPLRGLHGVLTGVPHFDFAKVKPDARLG